jgi:uncharacterized protein (TIGR02246 family)
MFGQMKSNWRLLGSQLGLSAMLFGYLAAAPVWATDAETAAKPSGDEAAIRASAETYKQAFAAGDAKALAATFADDGELIDATGGRHKGRADIEREFSGILANHPQPKLDVTIESIKFLSPDVAIETGTALATSANQPSGTPSRYTAVLVKRDGKWLLSNVNELQTAAPGSPAERLAGLAFLLGEWQADLGEGKSYRLRCEWLPGQSFLKRTFSVHQSDTELSSGVQVIGYDPLLAAITSWTFDSSGGFGHEIWEDHGGRWRISASSVLPDGSTSLAIDYLTKGTQDSFTWQSVERSLNDQLLPDSALIRVKRVSE